jgi:hypothetical protein
MGKNYIPAQYAEFSSWFRNLTTYVDGKTGGQTPAWPDVPAAAVAALSGAYAGWLAAYRKTLGAHTPADTEAKKEARKKAEKVIRPFVAQYLHFPPVTDADRVNMGLPCHGGRRSAIPAPSTVPEAEIKLPHPMTIEVHFHDMGSVRRGKPAGVRGAKIVYGLLDAPPGEAEELTRSEFCTRSPYTAQFLENERGKAWYFALCWENPRGKAGPRSVIQKAIVP